MILLADLGLYCLWCLGTCGLGFWLLIMIWCLMLVVGVVGCLANCDLVAGCLWLACVGLLVINAVAASCGVFGDFGLCLLLAVCDCGAVSGGVCGLLLVL